MSLETGSGTYQSLKSWVTSTVFYWSSSHRIHIRGEDVQNPAFQWEECQSICGTCFRTITPLNLSGDSWEGEPLQFLLPYNLLLLNSWSPSALNSLEGPFYLTGSPKVEHSPFFLDFRQGHVSKCDRLLLTHEWWVRRAALRCSCVQMTEHQSSVLKSPSASLAPGSPFCLGSIIPPDCQTLSQVEPHSPLLSHLPLQMPLPLLPWTIKFSALSPSHCIPAESRRHSLHDHNVFLAKRPTEHRLFSPLRGIQLPEASLSPLLELEGPREIL